MVMKFHGNVRGEVQVNFLALLASKPPHFHVRCPQIVRNCSRELSLEHCHSHACFVPKFWPFLRRSARAPTIKTAKGTVAIKGVFDTYQGKNKNININKFAGLFLDWVGGKMLFICFLFVFFSGHSLWGRKTHKQDPQKKPGTIP